MGLDIFAESKFISDCNNNKYVNWLSDFWIESAEQKTCIIFLTYTVAFWTLAENTELKYSFL
jgi:hypothetical protein